MLADDFQNRFFKKNRNIPRKTPLLESFLNKVAGVKAGDFIKKRLQKTLFPMAASGSNDNKLCESI